MSAAFVSLVAVLPTQQKICDSQGGYGPGKDGRKRQIMKEERHTHTESKLVPLYWKGTVQLITKPMKLKINKHEMYRKIILEYHYHGNVSGGSILPLQ